MKKLIIVASFIVLPFAFALAQPQPGAQAGGAPVGGAPIGGGAAPIGGGIALLLGMAAGYAGRSVFNARKKLAE